jgi:hypothetical protein
MATRRLDQEEIDELHNRVCDFVDMHMRNPDNPNMRAGSYPPDCTVGRTHFIVPVLGVNTWVKDKRFFDLLDQHFPGASMRDETNPDGLQRVYQLNIPIIVSASEKRVTTNSASIRGGAPNIEWHIIVTLVEGLMIGALYYRYTIGLVI